MKTNLNLWISTALALAIFAIALIWQRSGISATRGEIGALQQTIAAHENPPRVPRKRPGQPGATPEGERPTTGELLAMLPDAAADDMASNFRAVPIMFEQIKDYSSEELLELIEEMDQLSASDKSKAAMVGFVKSLLMVIVAEEVPERVMEMVEDGDGTGAELRAAAFAGLARKDPERARQWLDEADWPARQIQAAKSVLFGALLKSDLVKALELIRNDQSALLATSRSAISDASSDPALRQKLWVAAESEIDRVVQHELAKGLITGEFIRGGLQAVRRAFSAADFLDAKVKASIVEEFAGEAMPSEPDETSAWIRDALPRDDVPMALARAVRSWAQKDFNAAGIWLGAQPNSPERDEAIGTFATTVVAIDPVAAATWANSIEDAATRRTALDSTLASWRQKDPDAASAWADKNGIDTSQLPAGLRSGENE